MPTVSGRPVEPGAGSRRPAARGHVAQPGPGLASGAGGRRGRARGTGLPATARAASTRRSASAVPAGAPSVRLAAAGGSARSPAMVRCPTRPGRREAGRRGPPGLAVAELRTILVKEIGLDPPRATDWRPAAPAAGARAWRPCCGTKARACPARYREGRPGWVHPRGARQERRLALGGALGLWGGALLEAVRVAAPRNISNWESGRLAAIQGRSARSPAARRSSMNLNDDTTGLRPAGAFLPTPMMRRSAWAAPSACWPTRAAGSGRWI